MIPINESQQKILRIKFRWEACQILTDVVGILQVLNEHANGLGLQ